MGLTSLFGLNRKNRNANIPSTSAVHSTAAQIPRQPTAWERHQALKDDGLHKLYEGNITGIETLTSILTLNRNPAAPGIDMLIAKYIKRLPGVTEDSYGNHYVTIGNDPTVMWTSHCDTVSQDRKNLTHRLCYNAEHDILFRRDGNVLGADCGIGIWLMMQMIENKVPGLYAFFLDEESGGQGSRWAAKNNPKRFDGIDYCVSFDRKGFEDIVATQRGKKCCSTEFQNALAGLMMDQSTITPRTQAQGSFTDSASFMELIPECTNLCVGYLDQHHKTETQDVGFALAMRNFLVAYGDQFRKLPVKRDPTPLPPQAPAYAYNHNPMTVNWGLYAGVNDFDDDNAEDDVTAAELGLSVPELYALTSGDCEAMCEFFPDAVASLLAMLGYDEEAVAEYIADAYCGTTVARDAYS